jgi:16S rRNA (adenine1518-N6/adenine1519-N6)-dimethyltransferase
VRPPRERVRVAATTHRPRKRFGQHFLERSWADKVLRAIKPSKSDLFLEIGPGPGALTRPLAAGARHVIAFEIDRDLAATLREEGPPNVTVVEGDFLEITPEKVRAALDSIGESAAVDLKVAGNLPYNIAAAILFKCLELYRAGIALLDAVIMVQEEVGDRIMAVPHTREYGVLSVLLQREATIERLLSLPPGAFRPQPQVRSTLLRLRFHPVAPAARDEHAFQSLVRAVFTRRRKTLANALTAYTAPIAFSAVDALQRAQIDPQRRAETLTLAEFVRLSDTIGERTGP